MGDGQPHRRRLASLHGPHRDVRARRGVRWVTRTTGAERAGARGHPTLRSPTFRYATLLAAPAAGIGGPEQSRRPITVKPDSPASVVPLLVFDEANLVSAAGLVPVLRLAESAGWSEAIGDARTL